MSGAGLLLLLVSFWLIGIGIGYVLWGNRHDDEWLAGYRTGLGDHRRCVPTPRPGGPCAVPACHVNEYEQGYCDNHAPLPLGAPADSSRIDPVF